MLQSVCLQEVPDNDCDTYYRCRDHAIEDARKTYSERILACLIGSAEVQEEDDDGAIGILYEAIDDDNLRDLVSFGVIDDLKMKNGYFMAVIEP